MPTAIGVVADRVAGAAVASPPEGLGLLLRLRLVLLRNRLRQVVRDQPFKLGGAAISIALIWLGFYVLLVQTFQLVQRDVLEGIVATPLIFTFFFLALTGMLAFSNAILCYGGLFRRAESAYLLATPLAPRDVVIVKYLESLVLSSWSLVLLGVPLMMALARVSDEPWTFYPLFIGMFLLFIPMPGALGLFLAWLVVMVFPKTPRRVMVALAAAIAAAAGWWLWGIASAPVTSSEWLNHFYDRVSLIQNAMLPHTWVSRGIEQAAQGETSRSCFYLLVTLANALFASVVAVAVVARYFMPAFARAQSSGHRSVRRAGNAMTWAAEVLFAYLPRPQRALAGKDLKSFFRDPLQWSQMAILFGLLALYVSNVQRLWTDLADPRLQLLIAFLNLTAVSLILATFTSRFVFPLMSLDGQHLWLLGLLPLPRSRLIIAKFLYALTITLVAALGVMGASVSRLDLSRPLGLTHLISIGAVCVGLCGVSTGLGARLPVFHERNPARIAGGFGGTVNLFASIGLVVVSLAGVGMMSIQAAGAGFGDRFSSSMLAWLTGVVLFNAVAAATALVVGVRHFNRLQC